MMVTPQLIEYQMSALSRSQEISRVRRIVFNFMINNMDQHQQFPLQQNFIAALRSELKLQ